MGPYMSFRLQEDTTKSDPDISQKSARACTGSGTSGDGLDAGSAADEQLNTASSRQTLEYLSELTVELKTLAEQAGFRRLSLILLLAEQEARQQLAERAA